MHIATGLRRHLTVVGPLIALGFMQSAFGLSCRGLSDRYFVGCTAGICEVVFRVRDVYSVGPCGRIGIVEEVSPDMSKVVLGHISKRLWTGDFEVTLNLPRGVEPATNVEQFSKALETAKFSDRDINIAPVPAGASIGRLRKELSKKAADDLARERFRRTVDIVFGVTLLYALFRSTAACWRRLKEYSLILLAGPFAIQVGIVVLGAHSIMSWMEFPFLGLTSLFAGLIMIFESFALLCVSCGRRFRAKS